MAAFCSLIRRGTGDSGDKTWNVLYSLFAPYSLDRGLSELIGRSSRMVLSTWNRGDGSMVAGSL